MKNIFTSQIISRFEFCWATLLINFVRDFTGAAQDISKNSYPGETGN